MKNLWKNESGAVAYLLIVEFLLAIFVTVVAYMLIEDIVGFFSQNFYTGSTFDTTPTEMQWTSDVLSGIFKYILVFAVAFLGIRTILESTINRGQ